MVLLLFNDNSVVEIEECEDVIHDRGCFICIDYDGESLATFPERDILGYTLDPHVIRSFQPEESETPQT